MSDKHDVVLKDECCPVLEDVKQCDVMDFRYRLPFRPRLAGDLAQQGIRVEVVLRFRLERCPGPLTQGDLAYTTTLMPAEQVRLFTSDRRTRFTYDSESKVAYRNQSMSTESYYMAGMAQSMSNLSILDQSRAASDFSESSFGGGGAAASACSGWLALAARCRVVHTTPIRSTPLCARCRSMRNRPAATWKPARTRPIPSRSARWKAARTLKPNRRIISNRPRACSAIPTSATR